MTSLIGAAAFIAYITAGFELRAHVARLRDEGRAPYALPHRFALFGPQAWVWAFSHRHRELEDPYLTGLVMVWRVSIAALPVGVMALLAGA